MNQFEILAFRLKACAHIVTDTNGKAIAGWDADEARKIIEAWDAERRDGKL